ncbi:hypothetical protein CEXT_734361, partial [Caerostris extrusa]
SVKEIRADLELVASEESRPLSTV